MGSERTFKTAALTEVNAHILDAALDSIGEDQCWEFFCECGSPDCHERVLLDIGQYVALHAHEEAVLARGHRLSQMERARRLREESRALRAQAEHQVKRARKNADEFVGPET